MRRVALALLAACAPPVVAPPAPPDRSEAPGPSGHVPEDSAEATGPEGQAPGDLRPAVPAPLAPAPDAGLRVIAELRAVAAIAVPGRVVVLEPDFLHLAAYDAATGAAQWRVRAQAEAQGRHTLHAQNEQVLLHAGPTRIHVDARTGALRGAHRSFYSGHDQGCALRILDGADEHGGDAWRPPSRLGTTCADACGCRLAVWDCDTGDAIGPVFHATETHLYRKLSEPHDTVCFQPPALLLRAASRLLLRVEDDARKPVVAGLDLGARAIAWQTPRLAAAISAYGGRAGADPDARTCWLGDDEEAVAFSCQHGAVRWRARLGEGTRVADGGGGGLLLVRRRDAAVTAELRDLAAGTRRWRVQLAADRLPRLVGQPGDLDDAPPGAPVRAHALLDPATGAVVAELSVAAGEELRVDGDGFVRVGGGRLAEFDARGALLRERALDGDARQLRVGPRWLLELRSDGVRVRRRDTLAGALAVAGAWSTLASEAALGPDRLLLSEHRGQELRIVLLGP
jgi:hypothetical protein